MRTVILSLILASPIPCVISGCAKHVTAAAHTDPARTDPARTDPARTLTLDDYRQASRKLVLFLKNSERLTKFRESLPDGTDLVVFVSKIDINASEGQSDLAWRGRSFYNAMEEACAKEGMLFQQNLEPDVVGYDPTAQQLDHLDNDDRYGQTTDRATIGGAKKAALALRLEVDSMPTVRDGRAEYDYVLRVRVLDGKNKVLASETVTITK
jgi:hypothetical protein